MPMTTITCSLKPHLNDILMMLSQTVNILKPKLDKTKM